MRLKSILEDEFGDLDDADEFGEFKLEVDKFIDTPEDWTHKQIPLYQNWDEEQIGLLAGPPDRLTAIGQMIIGNINIALAESDTIESISQSIDDEGDLRIDESWIIVNDRPLPHFDYNELYELCEILGYHVENLQEFKHNNQEYHNTEITEIYWSYLYDQLDELVSSTFWDLKKRAIDQH